MITHSAKETGQQKNSGSGVGEDREVDGVGQNFKKGGRQHRRGLHKMGV